MTKEVNFERQYHELLRKHQDMNSERLVYIDLWTRVPVEQRMQIHQDISDGKPTE